MRRCTPPEKLPRASLLQPFYTIRSERQLMERLKFDLLYRWFVGLGIDDAVAIDSLQTRALAQIASSIRKNNRCQMGQAATIRC